MRRVTVRPALLLAALLLAGAACADEPRRSATDGPGEAPGACEPVERPPEQSGGHLLGEATPPVPYSSTPPTSGWHASGNPARGVHGAGDPLSEPEQVTILELGGVVLSWNGLDGDARERLESYAREHEDTVASTPYGALAPGEVAMTAWGVLQRCDGVDLEAVDAFVAEHAGGGPDH
ncbi:MAG TPA: DUF3105 domain-containing protein [Egibacteraceae bacterium]|nr:DUF3105 domain-containing protein [Egibacteraceae bacterium]